MTVFFDLDKTLLDVNSGSEWLRHEFAAGRVSIWQTIQALVWLFLGVVMMEKLYKYNKQELKKEISLFLVALYHTMVSLVYMKVLV